MERKPVNIHMPAWSERLWGASSQFERAAIGILALILVISAIFSLINFINSRTQLIPQAGGTYHEAAVGQPRHINPVLAGANDVDVDLSRLIYSGLFRFNNKLELENDIASRVEISEDNKTYTIGIREDVKWHDGNNLTADDVVFTIRSIQTPDYGSPLTTSFQGVTVEKIDPYTIRFSLNQPYAPFLSSLTVGIVPEHVWAQIEPQNAPLAEQMLKPVGSGPYKFEEITTRRKTGDITTFTLVRNDNYYKQAPYIDKIMFSFYISHEEAVQALLADKVDGIGFLPLEMLETIRTRRAYEYHRLLLPQYFGVFFNQNNNEALSEAGVRSALALATDQQAIVDNALKGQGDPVHVPIPPGLPPNESGIELPPVDHNAAIQNLEESGWQDEDGDGIREKDGKKLTIKLTTTDWPEYVRSAEILKEQWHSIGVEVELEHLGAGTIQQIVVQPRNYEALLFGEILPGDPDPYPFWHSTQTRSPGLNLSLFKNDEVDKLLEEARKTTDQNQRREMYQEFQNKIMELTPVIVLYRPYYLFATERGVLGTDAQNAALPAGRFNNIEQWHVNTKRIWR